MDNLKYCPNTAPQRKASPCSFIGNFYPEFKKKILYVISNVPEHGTFVKHSLDSVT